VSLPPRLLSFHPLFPRSSARADPLPPCFALSHLTGTGDNARYVSPFISLQTESKLGSKVEKGNQTTSIRAHHFLFGSHDIDRTYPRTPQEIYNLNRMMSGKMYDIFKSKGIPVVPSLGNNDIWRESSLRSSFSLFRRKAESYSSCLGYCSS